MISPGWAYTEAEIAQAVSKGAQLDLSDRAENAKYVRAYVIRDLLLGRSPNGVTDGSAPDPRGLRLRGAIVIGRLDLDYLRTDIGLELLDCVLRDGITAEHGRLARLDLTGSTVGHTQANKPALNSDALTVTGTLSLVDVHAHGRSGDGTIYMLDAHIGGQLRLRGATLTNESGPALAADRLTVDSTSFLDDGFTATGHGHDGAVRLLGGHIGGQLIFRGATLTNESGPALVADGLTVDNNAFLDNGFTATGHGHDGAVQLLTAVVKGGLHIDIDRVKSLSDQGHRMVVDGMTYRDLFGTQWSSWLGLLAAATPAYAAQPYRQLAAVTAAAGHDSDTRRVLMAQRRDQLARAGLKRRDILWGGFTGLTLGYGYQPWRALIALFAVTLATALLMALPVGARGLYIQDHPDQRCSTSDRIVLGVDTALPLITTPVGTTCVPRNTTSGRVITAAGITAQILGWAFATLFVAGFTGAVRKT